MIPTLETPRLTLQPLELGDADQVQPLFAQWEVVQYLNAIVPWPFPPDGAFRHYRGQALPAMARGDEWTWTLRLKSAPGKIIGAITLVKGDANNRGFWLAPPWWNQGLMTEAAAATNDFWFDVLGFPRLCVPKAAANIASRRISEKTGMRLIATEEHDFVSGRGLAEIWEITASEWHAHKLRTSPQTPG
jgi:ribosomal-protein-alanine N-acetyltransferase